MSRSDQVVISSFGILAMVGLLVAPVVCLVISYRAGSGKLPRNPTKGIRIPSLYASEQAWQAGHRAAIPMLWVTLLATLGADAAIALTLTGRWSDNDVIYIVMVWGAVLLVLVIIAAVVAGFAARRVTKKQGQSRSLTCKKGFEG